jgi:ATP/maltotriose-dependent transcriptional regulator MalT
VVPFIISVFVESRILKVLQVLTFTAMGTANIMEQYQEFYGPAMFLAAWLLMRHYGFLDRYARLKNTLLILFISVLSQISAQIHQPEKIFAGLNTLYYALFLVLLILIIWRDTLKQQEFLKRENISLQTNYKKLARELAELEEERKPYDLKAVKISPAEERVIEALTVYKASNREIAERLNIAESTVKLHLYNICNKIGVDNRFAIIDLCKYNFEA